MKEILESFSESSRERIKNPIIGSFLTAFLIYNWKAFVFLFFSKASIEDRIIVIKYEYSNIDSIVVPVFTSIAYLLLLPYLSSYLDKILYDIQTKRYEQKNKIKIFTLSNKKDTAKLEREIADIKAGTSDVEELRKKNEELLIKNTETENLIDKIQKDFTTEKLSLESKLTNLEEENNNLVKILQEYKEIIIPTTEQCQIISNKLGRERLRTYRNFCDHVIFKTKSFINAYNENDVGIFLNNKLIFKHDDINVPLNYSLTPLGFKVYIETKDASL